MRLACIVVLVFGLLTACGDAKSPTKASQSGSPSLDAANPGEYITQTFKMLAKHSKGISSAQRRLPPIEAVTASKPCPPGGSPIGDQVPEAQATPMSLCEAGGKRVILYSPKYAVEYEKVTGPGSLRKLILQLFHAHLMFEERKARGVLPMAPDDPALVACQEGRMVGGLLDAQLIKQEGEAQTGMVGPDPVSVQAYELAKREGRCLT